MAWLVRVTFIWRKWKNDDVSVMKHGVETVEENIWRKGLWQQEKKRKKTANLFTQWPLTHKEKTTCLFVKVVELQPSCFANKKHPIPITGSRVFWPTWCLIMFSPKRSLFLAYYHCLLLFSSENTLFESEWSICLKGSLCWVKRIFTSLDF